jgi:hypothetical protein
MSIEDQLILARLETLSKDIELARTENKADKGKVDSASPWYVKWAGILGVPAVALALLVSWSQFNLNNGSVEKTQAETQKVRIESLKTQAELQKQLDDLQKSQAAGASNPDINSTLTNIRSTIADIEKLREAEVKGSLTNIVMQVIIVWFVLNAAGLVLGIFSRIWNLVIGSTTMVVQQTLSLRSHSSRAARIFGAFFPIVFLVSDLVPTFVGWWVTIFILFTAAQPIAYEAATVVGQPQEFTQMMDAARRREFYAAAHHLVLLLNGSSTNP